MLGPIGRQLGPLSGVSRRRWQDRALAGILAYSPVALYSNYHLGGLALGSPVASWPDMSGNGYHALQTGADTLKPTYQLGADGVPELAFDGGDLLTLNQTWDALMGGINSDITVVLAGLGSDDFQTYFGGYVDSTSPSQWLLTTSVRFRGNDGPYGQQERTYTRKTTPHLLTTTADRDGNLTIYINGIVGTPIDISLYTGSLGSFKVGIGGVTQTSGFKLTGQLRCISVFPSALADPDRAAIETLVAQLAGVTL